MSKPQPSTPFTAAERAAIAAHFTSKCPNARCSLCGGQKFSIMDHFLVPMTSDVAMNINLSGPPLYPHAGIICDNCGHTHLMAGTAFGIITRAPTPAI